MTRIDAEPQASRLVVNTVGDAVHGRLAESRFVERSFLPGGEQNLYELAFAAAALGYEVELRGWLDQPMFERMAAGAGAEPATNLAARRPEPDDFIVVPEGWRDPLDYGRLLLSPARLAIFVLAAPGLFGWPFTASPWEPPDPLTVPIEAVARPEHFVGMSALGFELLSHSPGIVAASMAAGVECVFVGTGRPDWRAPPAEEKTVDIAAIGDNRWAPLADRVLSELDGYTIDRIETVSNAELVSRLARSRVLLWPSRVEGHATIPWEARGVGCVPVALGSNRFALGLDEAHGALVVDEVEALAPAIRSLLGDSKRWTALSTRGRETAPAQVHWDTYLSRVGAWLGAPRTPDASKPPLARIGADLAAWLDTRSAEAQSRLEELAVAREDLTQAARNQEMMLQEIAFWRTTQDRLLRENDALRAEKDHVASQLEALAARRAVRAALRIADTIRPRRG
jgi:hypothetical protein